MPNNLTKRPSSKARATTAAAKANKPIQQYKSSLAATHPARYNPTPKTAMPPPTRSHGSQTSMPKHAIKHPTNYIPARYPTPSPSQSPKERPTEPTPKVSEARQQSPSGNLTQPFSSLTPEQTAIGAEFGKDKTWQPWLQHTDPKFNDSDRPVYWARNCTVLKSDTCIGSVTSPTHMIGLPFGSMIEMASHYPSAERLNSLS